MPKLSSMFLTEYYEIFRFFIHRHAGAAFLDLLCGKVQHLFRLRLKYRVNI